MPITITIDTTAEQDAALTAKAEANRETLDAFVTRMTRKMLLGHADEAIVLKVRDAAPLMVRGFLEADTERQHAALDALALVDKGTRIARADEPEPEPTSELEPE